MRTNAIILAVLLLPLCPAGASIFTLTDANSSSLVDTGPAGMTNWTVDGVNQLNRQAFWFRVGAAGGETNIGSLPLVSASQPIPKYLSTLYQGGSFTVEVMLLLTGGTQGSGTSDVAESIRITNTSTTSLDFHFFQYCNLHLNGQAVNTSVEIPGSNTATQTQGPATVSETADVPIPSRHEVGLYPNTLNSLMDGSPTTLSNSGGPIGPGDLTWAFQWDRTIAPGGSFLISKDKHVVPEPATMSLLVIGGLRFLCRRRK
ncbi:MAG: PEP-CTERM sorting domain-containing protein [Planctomycetota bacterium]|nr:PEP-CTERM sorting domain-containing protein [Planctomycetota bacterium]